MDLFQYHLYWGSDTIILQTNDNLVFVPANPDLNSTGLTVLDSIGQQLADTAKQQGLDVRSQGLGSTISLTAS